jgi:spore maturation protein CgeB
VNLVVFGLTISSSWGNGHATLWRGLCRALAARGHQVTFFERDVPYYAAHRDDHAPTGCTLRLYADWDGIQSAAAAALRSTDVAMVTSFCPDAEAATSLVLDSPAAVKSYYDMDSGVTLDALARGDRPDYIPVQGLAGFDVVFSYTGGRTAEDLRRVLGARRVEPLYGSVDPDVHHPVSADPGIRCALSYLGTYAADRQDGVEQLLLAPARRVPHLKFVLAGSQYPADFPWPDNLFYLSHLPPGDHPRFYSSSGWTLNVTRAPMATVGFCPSGRLFEAAACATPIVTDWWEGLEGFFTPGEEIVVARTTDDVLAALDMNDEERQRIGRRARQRALDSHTAAARVVAFEEALAFGVSSSEFGVSSSEFGVRSS